MMDPRVALKIFTVLSIVAMSLGCSGKLPESSDWTSVALKDVPESLIVGDTLKLLMRVKYGPEREKSYDFSENDLGMKVEVNPQVAEYLGNGNIKLVSPGLLELSITSDKNSLVSEKASVKVLERNYMNVIGQPLHSKLIHSSLILKYNASMQTFGVSGDGDFYMCSWCGEKLSVQKINDKGIAEGDPMIISDADDGMCFSIEGAGTDAYMWMRTNDGIVVRERFVPGQSLSLKTCSDCYYLGNQSYVRLSVDNFKGRIAFFSSDDKTIRTCSLDVVKALPKTDLSIAGRVVRTADVTLCETVESLRVSIAKTEIFSMCDSRYYISGGAVNESAVTACDKDGNYYFIKLPYGVDDNTVKTIKYGLSDTGDMEPAGIVYANGSLYQGYRSTIAGETKNTIVKFGEVPLKGLNVNGFDGGHEGFGVPVEDLVYSNPIYSKSWPDPTIWRGDDGMFYSISTGQTSTRPLLCSPDLVNWKYSSIIPFDKSVMQQLMSVGDNLWAPDVAVVGGKRVMYVSVLQDSANSNIVALCETSSPGTFEFAGIVTSSTETGVEDTIDPEVVTDPITSQVWLFFGSTGRMYRVKLASDGISVADGAEYEVVAGLKYSDDKSRNKVFEGAHLYYRNGWWYLFVSSGWYNNDTYQMKVGRCKTLDGDFVDRDGNSMTEGYATPFMSSGKGDYFFGPGHNSEIFTDSDGKDWILYHCHQNNDTPAERPMMLQCLSWDSDGWPFVEGGKPASTGYKPKW